MTGLTLAAGPALAGPFAFPGAGAVATEDVAALDDEEADEADVAEEDADDDSGRSFFPSFSEGLATEGSFQISPGMLISRRCSRVGASLR